MENPFLCESCRPFGYCRKHHKVASEKVKAEFDETFYQRVNAANEKKIFSKTDSPSNSTQKLTSLSAIRALYRIRPNRVALYQQKNDDFVSKILTISKVELTKEESVQMEECCS
jgi:hypothetical protein